LKVSYYRNYCINFNQILHDRDHQAVIVGGPNTRNKSKMADGDEIWHRDRDAYYSGPTVKNLEFLKI